MKQARKHKGERLAHEAGYRGEIGTNGGTLTQGNTLGIDRKREEQRARKYEGTNNVFDGESTGVCPENAQENYTEPKRTTSWSNTFTHVKTRADRVREMNE